jgi:hypothetical protein
MASVAFTGELSAIDALVLIVLRPSSCNAVATWPSDKWLAERRTRSSYCGRLKHQTSPLAPTIS